jgi:hypothetical protein
MSRCQHCGVALPVAKRRPRKFCGDRCRKAQARLNGHRDHEPQNTAPAAPAPPDGRSRCLEADLTRELSHQEPPDCAEGVSGTKCRPVALRGHMCPDGGGYVPENDAWFKELTEPHPDPKFDHPNPARRRVGRDPMSIPLDVLTASGHPRRWCAAVLSAYRNGMGYAPDEGPKVRTYKELRSICVECADNRAEIRRCTIINCPLWAFRMGRNPHNPQRGKNPFKEERDVT